MFDFILIYFLKLSFNNKLLHIKDEKKTYIKTLVIDDKILRLNFAFITLFTCEKNLNMFFDLIKV